MSWVLRKEISYLPWKWPLRSATPKALYNSLSSSGNRLGVTSFYCWEWLDWAAIWSRTKPLLQRRGQVAASWERSRPEGRGHGIWNSPSFHLRSHHIFFLSPMAATVPYVWLQGISCHPGLANQRSRSRERWWLFRERVAGWAGSSETRWHVFSTLDWACKTDYSLYPRICLNVPVMWLWRPQCPT